MTSEGETIKLADGEATHMGEGVFILFQEVDQAVQTVVVNAADLRALLAAA